MEDILSEPVELIDQDLDEVAGGHLFIDVSDVNIAVVSQRIRQVQVGGFANDQAAANVSSVAQES